MPKTVEFAYAIGDEVKIVAIDRPARVMALLCDSDGPQFRVVFWEGGARKTEWLYPFEIKLA